jgi:thiosulfate dehydrogenase
MIGALLSGRCDRGARARSTLRYRRSLLACAFAAAASSAVGAEPAVPLHVPPAASIPSGPLGVDVRRGEALFNTTQATAKAYVGNGLQCTSCHLQGGTVSYAAPMVGLWGVFPEFVARSDSVETLADRINDCFVRSMNGRPLPVDGNEMRALLAYTAWLSTGVPTGSSVAGRGFAEIGTPPRAPDSGRGERVYALQCAACHGADGGGVRAADGTYAMPPLWGPQSFNDGAGMARVSIAAAFVHAKMPLGRGGSLTVQDAYDVAAYFTAKPRPEFAAKTADWPRGGKPADARN